MGDFSLFDSAHNIKVSFSSLLLLLYSNTYSKGGPGIVEVYIEVHVTDKSSSNFYSVLNMWHVFAAEFAYN